MDKKYFSGEAFTAETVSAVKPSPRKQNKKTFPTSLWCRLHCRNHFPGEAYTMVKPSLQKIVSPMKTLLQKFWNSFFVWFPWWSLHRGNTQIFEYLGEYKVIWKIVLAWKSGTHMELIHEKNRGSKISWHCPFKIVHIQNIISWNVLSLKVL